MGWIHVKHRQPADHLHNIATALYQNIEAECAQDAISDKSTTKYPILSKSIQNKDLPFIPAEEVRQFDGKSGCRLFIVVDETVLDCTTYISQHPGGQQLIEGFATQNCSWQWWSFHDRRIWGEVACTLRVGRTEGIDNLHQKPGNFTGLRKLGYNERYTW